MDIKIVLSGTQSFDMTLNDFLSSTKLREPIHYQTSLQVRHIKSIIGLCLIQTEKSQPEGKRIMPETRFTEFLALYVGLMVGICRSASETDV